MKQNKTVRESGPYIVQSHSQGRGIVYFQVFPAFMEHDNIEEGYLWAESRFNGDGGGPGMFTSIAVASALQGFLNSPYDRNDCQSWENRLESLLKRESENLVFAECNTCGIITTIKQEWKYCPRCGKKYINREFVNDLET